MRSSFVCCLLISTALHAQLARFVPCMGDQPLRLDMPITLPDGTPVTITQFRFYVGHFAFCRAGKVISRNDAFHLIDASNSSSFFVELDATTAALGDSISFLFGVDSLTNVSGAFGGDLDPTRGMYWAWNSGYINLKLEGTCPASPYASHAFELQMVGQFPAFATAHRIVLPVTGSGPWAVAVDVAPLLEAADIRTKCNVMSPGEAALRLSSTASSIFKHLFLSPEDDAFKR